MVSMHKHFRIVSLSCSCSHEAGCLRGRQGLWSRRSACACVRATANGAILRHVSQPMTQIIFTVGVFGHRVCAAICSGSVPAV